MLSWAKNINQFKQTLAITISLSMATSPLAWASGANQELQTKIGNYLRNTDSEKKQTIGQWFKVAGKYMHAELASQVRPWVEKHANEPMPKIESVATNEGQKERVRLLVHEDGKIINLDFIQQDGQAYMEFNGKKYTYDDLYYGDTVPTAFPADLVKTFTLKEFKQLAKTDMKKAINYMARIRGVMTALESYGGYLETSGDLKTSYVDFILETAYAAGLKNGDSCIVGGHVSTMNNGSCGNGDKTVSGDCQKGQIQCNGLVYGFGQNGSSICVSRTPATQVSVSCDKVNPLTNDPKTNKGRDMITGIIEKAGKDPKSEAAWNQYFTNLQEQITSAAVACGKSQDEVNQRFSDIKGKLAPDHQGKPKEPYKESEFAGKFPGNSGLHHRKACETILNRIFLANCTSFCAKEGAEAAVAKAEGKGNGGTTGGAVPGAGVVAQTTKPGAAVAETTPPAKATSPSVAVAASGLGQAGSGDKTKGAGDGKKDGVLHDSSGAVVTDGSGRPVLTGADLSTTAGGKTGTNGGSTSDGVGTTGGGKDDRAERVAGGAAATTNGGAAPGNAGSTGMTGAGKPPELGDSANGKDKDAAAAVAANTCTLGAAVADQDVKPPQEPPPRAPQGIAEGDAGKGLKPANMGDTKKRDKVESRTNIWPWVIGAGVLACLFWLCKNKKENKTSYVPVPPPLPGKGAETTNTSTSTSRPSYVR